MDLGLQGKVALVTGASKGIGRAIAQELAREGMRLALTARSGDLLEALADELGNQPLAFTADLTESETPARFAEAAAQRFGAIDLVVNNAGATVRGDFLALTEAQWQDGFALKFFGGMRLARAAWPHLVRARGSIVNIVGLGGRQGSAEFAIGGAVNAAILNLTKALADRGAREGVRVNAINPGSIETDRLTGRLQAYAKQQQVGVDEAARRNLAELGVARFGRPEEIAAAVAFLASARAGYISGAFLEIDGGQLRAL